MRACFQAALEAHRRERCNEVAALHRPLLVLAATFIFCAASIIALVLWGLAGLAHAQSSFGLNPGIANGNAVVNGGGSVTNVTAPTDLTATKGMTGIVTLAHAGQTCTASSCTIMAGLVNANAASNAIAANLPASTATMNPVTVCKTDSSANAVTITPNGTDTINGGASFVLAKQYQCAKAVDSAAGNWTVSEESYPVTQTLASHNFATQLSAAGVLSGAQPAFSDISGTAQTNQGGTGTTYGAPNTWTQKTNAAAGTTQNKLFALDSSGNAINVAANSTGGVLGICDTNCTTSGTGTFFTGPGDHSCVFDGGVTRNDYVGISTSVAGDCTDQGANPTAGTETIGKVDNATTGGAGTYTVYFYGPDYAGAGGGGSGINSGTTGNDAYYGTTTTVSPIANVIHAGTGTLSAAFTACPSGNTMCVVIADAGQTYNISSALIVGGTNGTKPETLLDEGGRIHCTDTGGAGHACIVIHDKGHVIGWTSQGGPAANSGNVIDSASSANIDSLVESYAAYSYSGLGVTSNTQCTAGLTPSTCCTGNGTGTCPYQQTNFDLEGMSIAPSTSMTLNKAVVWESAIDGDGYVVNNYIGPGPNSSIGVLVDDAPSGSGFTGFLWNNLYFAANELSVGGDAYGMKVLCSSGGGTALQIIGGSIVDGGSTTTAHLRIDGNGASPNCFGEQLAGVYFEGKTGESTSADFIQLNQTLAFTGHSIIWNGGPGLTNCINITGSSTDQLHIDGRETGGVCTHLINNGVTSYTYNTSGPVKYDYYGAGPGPIVDGAKSAVLSAKTAAIGTCGSGTLSTGSNAYFGRITMTSATSCILTPGFTCPNAVQLALTDDTTAGGAKVTAQSTTTATFSSTSGDVVDYAAGCR